MTTPGTITKTSFLFGRQCAKRFWLHCHGVVEPTGEDDEEDLLLRDESKQVEALAEHLFPGCRRMAGSHAQRVQDTTATMSRRECVAQATVGVDDLLVVSDILEPKGDGWFLWK